MFKWASDILWEWEKLFCSIWNLDVDCLSIICKFFFSRAVSNGKSHSNYPTSNIHSILIRLTDFFYSKTQRNSVTKIFPYLHWAGTNILKVPRKYVALRLLQNAFEWFDICSFENYFSLSQKTIFSELHNFLQSNLPN